MSVTRTLSEWFATPQGQYVLTREQTIFDRLLADIFGFNAVQLGLPEYNLLRASRIPLQLKAGKESGVHLWLESEELPFETGSIDLVVLPHILEFSAHSHQILREVERVLRPEGSVIISGFNPLSLWGMRRAMGQKKEYPWCGKFISLLRIKDWLALLGFEVDTSRFCCYAPPFAGSTLMTRSRIIETTGGKWWAVVGGVYFLQAKKRVPGMRLIKPHWNGRLVRKLVPASAKLSKEANSHSSTSALSNGHKINNE